MVQSLAALCREKDWLLLVDEVQTGIGRTGSLFAFQQFGIQPDVVSFAKGIAGGLPLGGILTNEKCAGVLTPGTHGSTFGANPVSTAAGLAVLEGEGRLPPGGHPGHRQPGTGGCCGPGPHAGH